MKHWPPAWSTFNPGPSQLFPETVQDLQALAASGFLSLSHRSAEFKSVCLEAVEGLREKLSVPKDYALCFQPSATAAMDTLLRNAVSSQSFHFVHGAFSRRFFLTAQELKLQSTAFESPWDEAVSWENAVIPPTTELIAVTHNETSTGLMWPMEALRELRQSHSSCLLAVDVTSSFGALAFPWELGDFWFASVQKCLGLPAGLGLLLVSPRAMAKVTERLEKIGGVAAWQQLPLLSAKLAEGQSVETPNMLAIALLAKQMTRWNPDRIAHETREKAALLYEDTRPWRPYVKAPAWRSLTVANLVVEEPERFHENARKQQFVLGKGYGPLKSQCIRLANFPALSLETLTRFLDGMSSS